MLNSNYISCRKLFLNRLGVPVILISLEKSNGILFYTSLYYGSEMEESQSIKSKHNKTKVIAVAELKDKPKGHYSFTACIKWIVELTEINLSSKGEDKVTKKM